MDKIKAKHTEISVLYNLPDNWAEETAFSFEHLSELVLQLHDSAYSATVKAINRFATIRNYVIGFYIVEYEQHGNDRAKYGDRLLKRLVERVNKRGINETLLTNSRKFYLTYPQIKSYLTAISPTASEKSVEKSPTPSDEFTTSAEKLMSNLSFSHIVELLTVDDSLARFFYETECVRCCWSVKELRRQISTNLYFRAGMSENPRERNEPRRQPSCGHTALHSQRRQNGGVCFGRYGQQLVCINLYAFTPRQENLAGFSFKRNWQMIKERKQKRVFCSCIACLFVCIKPCILFSFPLFNFGGFR